ncbi:hypothetical protein E4T25_11070 [Photobacterium damselae subsp. piscicida]|uniref:hypothetical protein n=1 Tax=Photobacterium damselae TaxID=38293 RepID=UPI00107637E2|nr:hypothetical protein [Photobacterium damselae]TFZ57839.1 hypothetical protein E4T25_11070 [Photobacterium damselae subsp. piscicida]
MRWFMVICMILIFSSPKAQEFTIEAYDMNIFFLYTGGYYFDDPVFVLEQDNRFYLPLNLCTELLELPIKFNIDNKKLKILGKKSTSVNVKFINLVENKGILIDADDLLPNDLYVPVDILSEFLKADISIDFSQLRIVIKRIETFPFQNRLQREKERKNLIKQPKSLSDYKLVKAKPFTTPLIDLYFGIDYRNKKIDQFLSFTSSLQLFNQNVYLAATQGSESNVDFRITNRDINSFRENNMGTRYAIGDTYSYAIPLVSKSRQGKGVNISIAPTSILINDSINSTVINGKLPDGFQVDLFYNGKLLDYQIEPNVNGEFHFDVDVFTGINKFDLVFYGESGQEYVETRQIYISDEPYSRGQFGFIGEFTDVGTPLISGRESNIQYSQGSAQFFYGISPLTKLYGIISSIDSNRYITSGLETSIYKMQLNSYFSINNNSKYAIGTELQGRYGTFDWGLTGEYFKNFDSQYTREITSLKNPEWLSRINTSFILPYFGQIPFFASGSYIKGEFDSYTQYATGFSLNMPWISFTNSLNYTKQGQESKWFYQQQLIKNFQGGILRGGMKIIELEKLQDLFIDYRHYITDRRNMTFGIKHNLERNGTTANIGYYHEFDNFVLGIDSGYSTDRGFQFGVDIRLGLGLNSRTNEVFTTSNRVTGLGLIIPKVFVDSDGDKKFSANDQPVEGVEFSGSYYSRGRQTDDNGMLVMSAATPYRKMKINIRDKTIPDISMKQEDPLEDFMLEPNSTYLLDIPLSLYGEVEIQFNIINEPNKLLKNNIDIVLTNKHGKTIKAQSSLDGFAYIGNVPLGTYTVSFNNLKEYFICSKPHPIYLTISEPYDFSNKIKLSSTPCKEN